MDVLNDKEEESMLHITEKEREFFDAHNISSGKLEKIVSDIKNGDLEAMYEYAKLHFDYKGNPQKCSYWSYKALNKGHEKARSINYKMKMAMMVAGQSSIEDDMDSTMEEYMNCVYQEEMDFFLEKGISVDKMKKLMLRALDNDTDAMYEYANVHWNTKGQQDKCYYWSYMASLNGHKKGALLYNKLKTSMVSKGNDNPNFPLIIIPEPKAEWSILSFHLDISQLEAMVRKNSISVSQVA